MTTSPTAQQSLDRRFVHGMAWTALGKWSTQILTWVSVFAVARLLAPADYGLVGMASIVLNLALLIAEFGVGTAVITMRHLTEHQIRQVHAVAVLVGISGNLLAAASAPLLAAFFQTPALTPVTVAMSFIFSLSAFRSVPTAVLQRDMQFKYLAFTEAAQALSQAISTMLIAWLGGGYWALVAGPLIGLVAGNLAVARKYRCRLAMPQYGTLKEVLLFTYHVLIGRVSWYLYAQADYFIVGKFLGKIPLGVYTMAFLTSDMPIQKMSTVLMRVVPSFLSAMKEDLASLRRYLRLLSEAIALVTFPFAVGLALTAEEVVPLALGQKWAGAALPIQILAWHVPLRALALVLPQVLLMVGESRMTMRSAVLTLLILPPGFYIGTHWGLAGVATVWVLVYPFCVLPLFWWTLKRIGMSWSEYFSAIQPPFVSVLLMAIAVFLVQKAVPNTWPLVVRAAIPVGTGVITYSLAIWRLYPVDRLATLKGLLLRKRNTQKTAAADNDTARSGVDL